MSQVQMAGHYGGFVYVPRPIVGYSRGNPPKQQILPPLTGAQYRSLAFRPRFLVRSRGNPVFPGVPNTAPLVFSQLQRVKVRPLDLTVQPPSSVIIPPPPAVPTMGFFFTMNPAILAQLLIRGFITPSQLLGPPRSPLFGREQLAEHRQYTQFHGQAARFA